MVFSSLVFLFFFLPLCLLLYYLPFGRNYKNMVLLLVSLVFYAWGEPAYLFLMLFSIAANYFFGLWLGTLQRRWGEKSPGTKAVLAGSVFLNLGLLGVFKYAGFFAESLNALLGLALPVPQIDLPIGISFYTFQIMTYVIDVYRGEAQVQRSITRLGAYITMFPQLIAGPIVRYSEVEQQLLQRKESWDELAKGFRIFIMGLSKKVLLANPCCRIADAVTGLSKAEPLAAWLGLLAYTMHIYFDFSGYSTMAIGLGRMLGLKMPENFNYPYIARSITDFWHRWHITLSTFFRDYLYIPLGGNRVSVPRWLVNIFITWFATGLWHGAAVNFILWGLYYGVLLVLERLVYGKYLKKAPYFVGWLYTFLLTMFGWLLFRCVDLGAIGIYLQSLFLPGGESIYSLGMLPWLPYLLAALIFATPGPKKLYDRLERTRLGSWVCDFLLLMMLVLCVASLTADSFNPFIYFRF